jgi:tetratricopeptide (TPR) repeat protein
LQKTSGKRPRHAAVLTVLAWLVLAASALTAPRADRWLEARAPHFAVVSNAGEEETRRVAVDFESVRTMLSGALPDALQDFGQPVVGLAVSNEQDFREVLPQFWERRGLRPVAAYWSGPHQHHIVLRVDASARERYRRLLHEYTHLLTHVNVPDPPAWLDEGLSELWGAATVRDDHVEVGRPLQHHLRRLQGGLWIPLEELLAMDRPPGPRAGRRLSLFYAQSWALARYLVVERAPQGLELAPFEYVQALRQHPNRLEAARQAFGNLPALERSLRDYVSSRSVRTVRVELPGLKTGVAGNSTGTIRVRPLSQAEALTMRARFLVDGERSQAALPLLNEAARLDPYETSTLETLGYLYFRQNKPLDAARWFEKAIASGPASYLAYYYRALLDAHRAEDDLRRAIDLNPRFAPAYARLADFYATEAARPLDAVPLLRRATELEPATAVNWVSLGQLLLLVNRPEEAREAAKKGLAHARSASSRELFESLFLDIERRSQLP